MQSRRHAPLLWPTSTLLGCLGLENNAGLSRPSRCLTTTFDLADKQCVTVQALIRRRVRVVDEDALYRIMVPQPLPLSWGRTVQPYDPSISLLSRVSYTDAQHYMPLNGRSRECTKGCIRNVQQKAIVAGVARRGQSVNATLTGKRNGKV